MLATFISTPLIYINHYLQGAMLGRLAERLIGLLHLTELEACTVSIT